METNPSTSQLAQELTEARTRIAELEATLAEYRQKVKALTPDAILLNALMENLSDNIYFKDTQSRFIRINKAMVTYLSLTHPVEVEGKTDFDLFTEEHARPAYEAEQEIMRTGQPLLDIEEKETWSDGRETWVTTSKWPLYDETGQIAGTFGVSQDITARRQAEKALEEEHRLLRTLIDNIPDYVFVKDRESRFVINNIAHLHALGQTWQDEIVGKTDFDIFPQELASQYYADEQEVIQSGRPLDNREEQAMDWITGRTRWLWTTKVPLYDSEGKVKGLVGISRDITERKQAEAKHERLQQEVIEAQQRIIQELSTPIIPLLHRIVVVPLIGSIDAIRAKDITRKMLEGIRKNRAKVVILDITGVPLVDSGVAMHLGHAIQAARLKGARTIITGVSDAVAETIVDLGIDWIALETRADLQTGLLSALDSMGFKLIR